VIRPLGLTKYTPVEPLSFQLLNPIISASPLPILPSVTCKHNTSLTIFLQFSNEGFRKHKNLLWIRWGVSKLNQALITKWFGAELQTQMLLETCGHEIGSLWVKVEWFMAFEEEKHNCRVYAAKFTNKLDWPGPVELKPRMVALNYTINLMYMRDQSKLSDTLQS